MKFSMKLPDDRCHRNPLLKAKIPVTIFSQPFTSAMTTAVNSASDLSFSISSNFHSGPSFKLSYSPSAATSSSLAFAPFSLLLKSGLGVFGSPGNSPLVFSAHFSLAHTRSVVPTFSLDFKPQFGNFCLNKCTSSNSTPLRVSGSRTSGGVDLDCGSPSVPKFGNGFLQEDSMGWQELKLESASGASFNGGTGGASHRQLLEESGGKAGFLSGLAVMARTLFPVTKRVAMNFRWGVKFPANLLAMPYLTVNMVAIERVDGVKEMEKKSDENDAGELELLKGICLWMRRELETLEKENREMRQNLKEMKTRNFRKNVNGEKTGDDYGGFERWRSDKNGGEDEGKKMQASEVESELERTINIMAAAASQLHTLVSRVQRLGSQACHRPWPAHWLVGLRNTIN